MKRALIVVMVVSSMASAQLAGYWTFDEGTGTTVADSSGNSKTGTLYAADSSNYPQWITGHIGNALQFNAGTTGVSNFNKVNVAISGADALANLTNEAFTVAMWVRRDAGSYGVVEPGIVGTDLYEFDLATDPNGTDADGKDYLYRTDLVELEDLGFETAAQKTLGSWYHYAVAYDGTNIRKYVNGSLVSTVARTLDFNVVSSGNFFIASNNWDAYFVGALDDVAIWTGKYLVGSEIAKLANGTATPLTAVESSKYIPPAYYMETTVLPGGWSAVWNQEFTQMMVITDNHPVYNGFWHFPEPDSRQAITPWNWYVKYEDDYNDVPTDITKYGVQWIGDSWNGREPNMTVMAAYITPGMVLGQKSWDYSLYAYFPYFRCKMRIAAENANGASARVTVYTLSSNTVPTPDNYSTLMTYLGEDTFPLNAGDHIWKTIEFILPKLNSPTNPKLWFEIAIEGDNANTVLYIDALRPASDQTVTVKPANINKDATVDYEDIALLSDTWLDTVVGGMLDPRSGGLLVNGDFSADKELLQSSDARVYMNPTGWTFTGTVAGNYGIQRVDNRGELNFTWLNTPTLPAVVTPLGGYVAAYLTDKVANDPYGVLEQTTTATAVSGQTYYAMAYVMTNTWNAWKDVARMDISIDGVIKASAGRVLSRNKWRAIYCTYTAQAADAGKPIKISISYQDLTFDPAATGCMLVGYAYLGTTMPNEWPEKRQNILVNGGFEDLTEANSVSTTDYPLYRYLTAADNYGKWFTTSIHPTIPNWVYEVPAGFDFNNKVGMWGTGYFGSPLLSPGSLTSVALMIDNNAKAGQVVGTLAAGTTYYLDAACGIWSETYTTSNWPNPAPVIRLELWRIPAAVTDGTVIYNAIVSSNPGYVKVAEAAVPATGNVKALGGQVQSKWQIIGTTYTATSLDTNMYVRILGSGGISSTPEYAFSDVYLSTQKREVPGGSMTFNLSSGLQYDTIGPYDCYHATLMGVGPVYDRDSNCLINLADFAIVAADWMEVGFY